MTPGLLIPLFAGLGPTELLIIVGILVLLFGAKKLPELARGSGRALRIFKAETKGLLEDDDKDEDEAKGEAEEAEAGDGPVFEATDRRGSVTVDSTGVRFRLDDTEAEFTWPEIGAVEYKTSRFGRRLVLSVHDSRGVCPAEVEAKDKAELKGWAVDLEAALDAYFEETA